MAAFFAVLYHFGIMQVIIKGVAWVMTRLMGVSGAESLNVAASIFMGQTEAPLTIRPLLPRLTRSEMMTVMTAGMAHVSGGIMAAYIANGVRSQASSGRGHHDRSRHAAGRQDAGAGNGNARQRQQSGNRRKWRKSQAAAICSGAIARGTGDGLNLAINVAAMLIAFLALIALFNGIMGWVHGYVELFPSQLANGTGLAIRAGGVAHRHSLERRARKSVRCWAFAWWAMN